MGGENLGPLVVDIETAGQFHELTQPVQEYLIEREKDGWKRLGKADQSVEVLIIYP